MNPQEALEQMITNAWSDFNEIALAEIEDDYGDAMQSMERTEAQGYAEGLGMAYAIVYGKAYNPPIDIVDANNLEG
jgi:predicted transcriptional regulator